MATYQSVCFYTDPLLSVFIQQLLTTDSQLMSRTSSRRNII